MISTAMIYNWMKGRADAVELTAAEYADAVRLVARGAGGEGVQCEGTSRTLSESVCWRALDEVERAAMLPLIWLTFAHYNGHTRACFFDGALVLPEGQGRALVRCEGVWYAVSEVGGEVRREALGEAQALMRASGALRDMYESAQALQKDTNILRQISGYKGASRYYACREAVGEAEAETLSELTRASDGWDYLQCVLADDY
jgi:hypothetical protein